VYFASVVKFVSLMKNVVFIIALGLLATSCGNSDVEAANELCACYAANEESVNDAIAAESVTKMMESIRESNEISAKCIEAWRTKFEGKFTKDGIDVELKKQCPDAYDEAKKQLD
jgi:hypothetical protein